MIKLTIITQIAQLLIGQVVLITSNDTNADTGVDGNIAWSIDGDTLTLSVQSGQQGTDMRNYPDMWSAQWSSTQQAQGQIKHIVINEGISTIGDYAFRGIYQPSTPPFSITISIPSTITYVGKSSMPNTLTGDIVLPDNVVVVQDNAFQQTWITSITISDRTSSIGQGQFQDSRQLIYAKIGQGSIGRNAFQSCSGLYRCIMTDNVHSIGVSAFSDTYIHQIYFSNNLNSIEQDAFYEYTFYDADGRIISDVNANNMRGKYFSGGRQQLYQSIGYGLEGDQQEWIITYDQSNSTYILNINPFAPLTLAELPNRTTTTRPTWESSAQWQDIIAQGRLHVVLSGIINIGNYDFYQFHGTLTMVYNADPSYIGVLTAIGTAQFAEVDTLEYIIPYGYQSDHSIAYMDNNVVSIGTNQFSGVNYLDRFVSTATNVSFGNRVFWGVVDLTHQEINSSTLGIEMFYQAYVLNEIVLTGSPTSIPSGFAYACSSLTSVNIPNTVTTIGLFAFQGSTTLTSISIPDSVTEIQGGQFRSSGIENITFGTGLITLGADVFRSSNLISVSLPDSLTTMGINCFYSCANLQYVSISGGLTEIPQSTFAYCRALSTVAGTNNIITIGNSAFLECSSYFEDYIGLNSFENVVSIGTEQFRGAGAYRVQLSDTVSTIGEGAFREMPNLMHFLFYHSSTLTAIPANMQRQCPLLEQVVLPASITSIGQDAFMQSSATVNFYVEPTVPPTVDGTTQITPTANLKIWVPEQSVQDYKSQWATWEQYIVGVPTISISIPQSIDLSVYGGQIITPTIEGDSLWYGDVLRWTSQDSSLVSVDNNGNITTYGTVSSVVITVSTYQWFYDTNATAQINVNVIYNSESTVNVIEGFVYDYTITPSVTPQTITLYGNASSWVSVTDYTLHGIVPTDISAQNELVVVQRTSQIEQTYSWHITFILMPSITVVIGDDATAEVYSNGNVIILGSGQTYADTLIPFANIIKMVDIRGLTTITNGTLPVLANEITLILGDSVHTYTDSNNNTIAGLVIGTGLTEIPQGLRLYNQATELITDVANACGHIFVKSATNDNVLYQADDISTRNSYNNATCYAVVRESLVNSPADLLEFRFTMLREVTEQIQNFITLSTQSWEVTVPTGAGFKNVAITDGILTGTAPTTKGTYSASQTHKISNNQYQNADYMCTLSPLELEFTIQVEKKLIIG